MDQCLGEEWVKTAHNSTTWRSKLEEMTNWTNWTERKMVDRTFVQIE